MEGVLKVVRRIADPLTTRMVGRSIRAVSPGWDIYQLIISIVPYGVKRPLSVSLPRLLRAAVAARWNCALNTRLVHQVISYDAGVALKLGREAPPQIVEVFFGKPSVAHLGVSGRAYLVVSVVVRLYHHA